MKKYRVFKGGGQQMNPTAMWFAQMGAQQPSQEEMMMMQQQQQQGQQGPPQGGQGGDQISQLAQQLSKELQDGTDLQDIIAQLMQAQVPPQAIMEAFNILLEQGVVDETALQEVASMLRSSQGGQEQGQPSEEEMMAMQQQQMAQGPEGQAPMARKGYINKRLKIAQAGMANESGLASDTNLIANKNIQKNALLNFTQQNVMSNQFGQDYDQMYNGGSLEQARYGRGKARRAERQERREEGQGDNWAKNQGKRARQLARRAVKEMPGTYSKGDKRALREGLESGEFDKRDVHRGIDVFNPQSKPGYPTIDAGNLETKTSIDEMRRRAAESGNAMTGPDEAIEETSTESEVINNSDGAWDYKKENGILYTRRKGTTKWTEVDPESNAGRAIRKKVYGEDDVTFDEGSDYIDTDDNQDVYDDTEFETDQNFVEYDDDGNIINQQVGDFAPYDSEGGEDYSTYLRGLPYDDEGYAYDSEGGIYDIDDYNRSFNRSGMNNYNYERNNRAIDFRNMGYAGYSGDGIKKEYGGAYELEQARFGRGRARRQDRREERQGRRALGQMDKAMRGAYGDIAFPAGVSPMMAGMPMMGTQGAMSPRMHFEGERGLFGRLKNFKMDIDGMGMPMNFSRGMFMNGIFNPYGGQGQQGGYNDTAYKISYPGITGPKDEEKEKEEKKKENQEIDANTPGGGNGNGNGSEESNEETNDEITCKEGEFECGGHCWPNSDKDCPDDYTWSEEHCDCITDEDDTSSDNTDTKLSCLESKPEMAKLSAVQRNEYCVGEKGKGFAWNDDLCGCKFVEDSSFLEEWGLPLLVGGVIIYKIGKGVKAKYYKVDKNAPKETKSKWKKAQEKYRNWRGGKGEVAPIVPNESTRAKPTKQNVDKWRNAWKNQPVVETPIVGSNTNRLAGSSSKLLGPGGKAISEADRALLGSKNMASSGLTREALEKIAKKYGIKVAGKSTGWIHKALRAVGKIRQEGGAIDAMNQNYGNPDLYRFTGGGHPGFVDYFADGGYYDDGGYYSENVNDPYMPYMEPGGPIVNRPYATAAEYGNEYDSYPGPYVEPMITDSIRNSVINSGRQQGEGRYNMPFIPPRVNRIGLRPDVQYGDYQEGDEVYMTGGELAQYLAGGGQVEFID